MDPALASAFALALEKSVNAALIYDAGTRYKLKQLAHSVFHFELQAPELSLFMEVLHEDEGEEARLVFSVYCEKNITSKISGRLLDFLSLLGNSTLHTPGNISSLADSGIRVQGNTAKLAIFQELMQDLDIDWEQALIDFSAPLGEGAKVVSHQFAEAIKSFLNWKVEKTRTLQNNLVQFLLDEINVLPNKLEFEEFSSHITELRAASERLQAKLNRYFNNAQAES